MNLFDYGGFITYHLIKVEIMKLSDDGLTLIQLFCSIVDVN